MAKIIIEPKFNKEGQIEYFVNYHDPKSDNSFLITATQDIEEAISRLKTTLDSEAQSMIQRKK